MYNPFQAYFPSIPPKNIDVQGLWKRETGLKLVIRSETYSELCQTSKMERFAESR